MLRAQPARLGCAGAESGAESSEVFQQDAGKTAVVAAWAVPSAALDEEVVEEVAARCSAQQGQRK